VHREVYESTNGRPTGVSLSCRYATLAVFEGTLLIRSATINLSELSILCKQRKEINFTKLCDGSTLLRADGVEGGMWQTGNAIKIKTRDRFLPSVFFTCLIGFMDQSKLRFKQSCTLQQVINCVVKAKRRHRYEEWATAWTIFVIFN